MLSNSPLVSIGLPVRNGEETIREAISSIKRQDYPNIEVLISDNASQDGTCEIVSSEIRLDKRFKLFRQEENIGMFANFSFTFQASKGKYFMLATHDDTKNPEFISECVKILEANPDIALCMPKTYTYCEGKLSWMISKLECGNQDLPSNRIIDTLSNFPAVAMHGVYRSRNLHEAKPWRNILGDDINLINRLSLLGKFQFVPKAVLHYNERPAWNSLHQDKTNINYRKRYIIPKKIINAVKLILFVNSSKIGLVEKIKISFFVSIIAIWELILKMCVILLIPLSKTLFWKNIVYIIYWRFYHNKWVKVVDKDLFSQRNINTIMGFK